MNIIDLLKHHDEKYDAGKPEVSDTEYDKLRETAKELYPGDPYFQSVGAPKGKVKLPYHLGSLNKVKTDNVLAWLKKNGKLFVISEKIDGASFMVEYQDGEVVAAYTRGDGEQGQDITEKAKLFCPTIDFGGYWAFRGEAVLPNPFDFGYKNRRNGAAGLLNKDDATN
jgi:DNA ligase (NAD+)